MFFLRDIITYVRRIIKTPSNLIITDNLIIDYINRFWISDVDARMQVFDLKTKYQFQTSPGVDQYNMPLYSIQSETPGQPNSQDVGMYPVYQGFIGPAYITNTEVFLFWRIPECSTKFTDYSGRRWISWPLHIKFSFITKYSKSSYSTYQSSCPSNS